MNNVPYTQKRGEYNIELNLSILDDAMRLFNEIPQLFIPVTLLKKKIKLFFFFLKNWEFIIKSLNNLCFTKLTKLYCGAAASSDCSILWESSASL